MNLLFTETKEEAEDGGWGWVVVAGRNRKILFLSWHATPKWIFLRSFK
jgi:hypothetical protein